MPRSCRWALRTCAPALLAATILAGCGGGSGAPPPTMRFHSRPDLTPPVVQVRVAAPTAASGYIFIAPKQGATQKGPLIVDDRGQPVWIRPVPGQATDFRVQTYEGRPVLTWWQGPPEGPVPGSGAGHGVIVDGSYRQIARVDAGFGLDTADLHEFQLTPQGNALLTAFRVVPADLSSVGGPRNGKVVDCVVQEVVVATGRVVFTWHSVGHVSLSESYSKPPPPHGGGSTKPYDYFHVNSVDQEPDGDLLVSARNTHAVYEISRHSGAIVWRLGGKRSTFRMGPGTEFAWQHDARRLPDGTISIFDDEAAPAVASRSRAIRIRLDLQGRAAALVHAYADGRLARSQGNAQLLPNGDTLVGWGAVPAVTEFTRSGRVVFDMTFSHGDDSYRAYRFAWSGHPLTRPSVAVEAGHGGAAILYASWNGATAVASWHALAGINGDHLRPVGATVRRSGFETKLDVPTKEPYVAVEALAADGRVLARSAAVQRGGLAIG